MKEDDPIPPLRMAPEGATERLVQKLEREKELTQRQQEESLMDSLAPFRVGSVRFLNAVPLTRGLEEEVTFATPSRLAAMLQNNELDAALVSVTEVLFHDEYDVLDGIAVASLGEVMSVILAHRKPIEKAEVIHCDPASLTSVNLLKVLLAEKGLQPKMVPLETEDSQDMPDFALLIGDRAIDFRRSNPPHQILDLGLAWKELTNLPFVYAVWALRRGLDYGPLIRHLREARNFGLDTLETIIREREEYDEDFRRDYLSWHIHYHLGQDERNGLLRFMELLKKHKLGTVHEPRFVT